LRLKYGLKWSFPAFIEVAFVWCMNFAVGDPYVPHITASMGLFITFFMMVFRSGLEKRGYDGVIDIII